MACSLLVEQLLIMMLGSNWEILDGDGRDCCLTLRRSFLVIRCTEEGELMSRQSETFTPPIEEIQDMFPGLISTDLEPHGIDGPVGSSFSNYQYPVIGMLSLRFFASVSNSKADMTLSLHRKLLCRLEEHWCCHKSSTK